MSKWTFFRVVAHISSLCIIWTSFLGTFLGVYCNQKQYIYVHTTHTQAYPFVRFGLLYVYFYPYLLFSTPTTIFHFTPTYSFLAAIPGTMNLEKVYAPQKKKHSQKDLFELNKKCQSAYSRPITQIYFRIRLSSCSVFPMPILEPSSQYIFRHKPLPFFIFFTTYIIPFYQQCTVVHVYNNI